MQRHRNEPQGPARLEEASGSPAYYLVWPAKERQWETCVDTLDPGSGQIAVEEGRDGLAGLRDLVVVVVVLKFIYHKNIIVEQNK